MRNKTYKTLNPTRKNDQNIHKQQKSRRQNERKNIRNLQKTAINTDTDWSNPIFINRAAAQKIVLPGTIHRFVGRSEHNDLQHFTLHSVGATRGMPIGIHTVDLPVAIFLRSSDRT